MKNQRFITQALAKIVLTLLLATPLNLLSRGIHETPCISVGFNASSVNSFTNNILDSGHSNDLLISYNINPAVAINVGYNTSAYSKKVSNIYQTALHPGLLLGMDYFLKPKHQFLSSSVNLSLVNSFTSFENFKNSHADLTYRLNFYKTFYVGVGVNYTRNSITSFSASPFNNTNLILQIGIRGIGFKFGK